MTFLDKETHRRNEERARGSGSETRIKRKRRRPASAGRYKYFYNLKLETRKSSKSARGMPRLSEAMKDVTSCDKLRSGANGR